MDKIERRNSHPQVTIDPQLISQGKTQLESEIRLLEKWLEEIKQSGITHPETLAHKKAYGDMLKSRYELLHSLLRQENELTEPA